MDEEREGGHLVEEALVVHGLAGGAHIGLAEGDLLADVALAVARQLALLHTMRVPRIQPPLPLSLAPPLLPENEHTNAFEDSRA